VCHRRTVLPQNDGNRAVNCSRRLAFIEATTANSFRKTRLTSSVRLVMYREYTPRRPSGRRRFYGRFVGRFVRPVNGYPRGTVIGRKEYPLLAVSPNFCKLFYILVAGPRNEISSAQEKPRVSRASGAYGPAVLSSNQLSGAACPSAYPYPVIRPARKGQVNDFKRLRHPRFGSGRNEARRVFLS
jgi:hypothetical protein